MTVIILIIGRACGNRLCRNIKPKTYGLLLIDTQDGKLSEKRLRTMGDEIPNTLNKKAIALRNALRFWFADGSYK